jgi:hypothetical protein
MTTAMEPMIAYGVAAMLLRTEMAEKGDRFDEDDRSGRGLRNARELERTFTEEKQRLKTTLMPAWGVRRRFRHAYRARTAYHTGG